MSPLIFSYAVADYADILEVDIAFLVAVFILFILSIIVAGKLTYYRHINIIFSLCISNEILLFFLILIILEVFAAILNISEEFIQYASEKNRLLLKSCLVLIVAIK